MKNLILMYKNKEMIMKLNNQLKNSKYRHIFYLQNEKVSKIHKNK